MDFKVTDKIGSTLNQGSIKLNLKDSAGIKSALNREKSDTSDIKKVSEGAATEDASTLTISNIKNYIDTAKNSLTAIADIRTKQLKLAQEASESPQSSRSEDLNDEAETLQSEIDRIKTTSTYNGMNVLTSGRTLTSEVNTGKITETSDAIAIQDSTYLTRDLSLNLTSQSSADTAVDSLEDTLSSVSTTLTSLKSSYDKADNIDALDADKKGNDLQIQVMTPRDAKDISKEIAYQIGSPFNTEKKNELIIDTSAGNLDSERVSKLLEE